MNSESMYWVASYCVFIIIIIGNFEVNLSFI